MNRFMQFIDFGGLQGGGFQNALAMGLQMGQAAGEARSRREYENALAKVLTPRPQGAPSGGAPSVGVPAGSSGIVATPEQEAESARMRAMFPNAPEFADDDRDAAMRIVAQRNPQMFMALQQREAQAQAQQEEAGIVQAAMNGNPQALQQLAVRNFDKWKAVDPAVRRKAEDEAKILGNAALDLLNTPAEQRGAKLQGYAQQMSAQFPEVAQIAQLPPDQLEAKLRTAVFEAQMVDKLIAMERPDYMAIPEGGTLVNTRDPSAVQQFGAMGAPQPAPQQGGGQSGNVVTMQDLQRMARGMGSADAMMGWMRKNNITVRVNTPQEAMNLPAGTPILLPDGTIGSVPR